MIIPYVDLTIQHSHLKKDLLSAVSNILDHSHFILSKDVSQFEKTLAEYCGTEFALGLNSGTDALFLSYKALGIGPGDEVILPPNTFLATASSIIQAQATPIFVDVLPDYMIDPDKIEEKITKRTKAIVVVHLTGKPVNFDPILEIANKHNLYIIEDAAQAIGAEYKGKKVGGLGTIGCFSLHPVKTLNACGDGGAIVTNSKELYDHIRQLRHIGLKNRDEFDFWGYNSRLDSIQAAILNVKFPYLNEWNAKRRENAAFYIDKLKEFVWVPMEESFEKQVYHTFMIRHSQRDLLQKHLEQLGIESRIHYPIPIHLQNGAKTLGFQKGDFPICEKIVAEMLSLPIHQDLKQEEIAYITDSVINFCKKSSTEATITA